MLYLYYTSFILLLGAEMNQIVEDVHPEGKNAGDKAGPEQSVAART